MRDCKKFQWKKSSKKKKLTLRNSLQEDNSTQFDEAEHNRKDTLTARDFADKISYAFQLATAQGPMCHEPMQGIAVFLEEVIIRAPAEEESSTREVLGRLTGEVIKTTRDSIRQGFLDWSPRLLLAMYSCEIQASSKSTPYPSIFPHHPLLPNNNPK